ncbi:helix-turn-helix transcriptional regulator [Kitasatospora sp. NPDC002227]|uniref:ArsR/SmtB family transcription factor n=1 Tax=Kitasatospora sp. NPDC002227 TaxID=3154773 RepID=UPI0033259963
MATSRTPDPAARGHHPDIARAAALIADPSRARILKSLGDGRSLSAKVLAAEAGVGAPTASVHLAKLVEAGLITAESVGRSRYYRLAGPEVSLALEALAMIAPPVPITSLRESSTANALRRSRTCYDHLAGRLGVAVMGGLLQHGILAGHDGRHRGEDAVRDQPLGYGRDHEYRLTEAGREALDRFGVDLAALPERRQLVRYCVDWSEQQHHLAGGIGAALMARLFELGWLRYGVSPRVVHLNTAGATGVGGWLGLRLDDLVA